LKLDFALLSLVEQCHLFSKSTSHGRVL